MKIPETVVMAIFAVFAKNFADAAAIDVVKSDTVLMHAQCPMTDFTGARAVDSAYH